MSNIEADMWKTAAEEARAEREELRARIAGLEARIKGYQEAMAAHSAEAQDVRERWIPKYDRMRAALKRYGVHDHGQVGAAGKCPRWYGSKLCTCGLSGVLDEHD